jgi:hypothetical protein
MAITVRVRGIEVVCETLDDLDKIIERYGDTSAPPAGSAQAALAGSHGVARKAAALDNGLLQAFAQAPGGVQSKIVEGMLGVRGKAIRSALRIWAARVHLSPDTIEKANPGGKRGWKLNESGIAAARTLLHG